MFEATLDRMNEACQYNNDPFGLDVPSADQAHNCARDGWQFIAVGSALKFTPEGAAAVAAADLLVLFKPELVRY